MLLIMIGVVKLFLYIFAGLVFEAANDHAGTVHQRQLGDHVLQTAFVDPRNEPLLEQPQIDQI